MSKDLIILYSGGSDSCLLLEIAKQISKTPFCILIDYGQKHIKELEYAEKQLLNNNINYQIIKIEGLNINSGLTGNKIKGRWNTVHEMNVPARNTIFLGIAMGIAENLNIDEIWYGADFSDRLNNFPDCYQEYVVKINELSKISGVTPIKIIAPLLGMSKELILQLLKTYNPTEIVYSGYDDPVDN